MTKIDYNEITDTHLSKKYNDLLAECMYWANVSSRTTVASPHIDNLMPYFASVETLYINSFFLFVNVHDPLRLNNSLTISLMAKMEEIDADIKELKTNPKMMTAAVFEGIVKKCKNVHMLIMYGLQKRHMLVRVSEQEPRGEQSVLYWDERASFKKGGIKGDRLLPGNKHLFVRY